MKGIFNATNIKGMASRETDLSWTMDPIRDPHKLALMRCAYQKAVANCGRGAPSATCPNCAERFREFYDGHDHKGDNEACLDGCCWFGWGSKKEVPKACPCKHVGYYCGVYVWVLPGRGLDELSKLTLTILDFALYSPAPPREKEVVVEYEVKEGKQVPKSVTETYIAPYGEPVTIDPKVRESQPKRSGPNIKDFSPGGGLLEFELRRRTLVPLSFRRGG